MGWNSWNCWAGAVSDAKVGAAADAMVAQRTGRPGLSVRQYRRLLGGPERPGEIRATAVPHMKALAAYVHSKGLKLGIYSSPGPQTCAASPEAGSTNSRTPTPTPSGASTISSTTGARTEYRPASGPRGLTKPYGVMRPALDAPAATSSSASASTAWATSGNGAQRVGGNCWHTTGDIVNNWRSMSAIGWGQAGHEVYAGPGLGTTPTCWSWAKWAGVRRCETPQGLKPNEQVTHITLWSLLAAPLFDRLRHDADGQTFTRVSAARAPQFEGP